MSAIYQDSQDVYVANYIIYAGSDGKAYTDSAKSVQFTTSALKDYFLKGAVIVVDTDEYAVPVGYAESSSIGSVTYIVPNSVTATSADIATLVAVADPE